MRKIIVLQNEAELGVAVLGRLWRLKCSRHTSHELQLNLRQPPWPGLRPSARPRILCWSPLMQLFVLCFNVNRVSVHTISPRSNLYSPLLHPGVTYLKWPRRAWPRWLPVLSHVCRFDVLGRFSVSHRTERNLSISNLFYHSDGSKLMGSIFVRIHPEKTMSCLPGLVNSWMVPGLSLFPFFNILLNPVCFAVFFLAYLLYCGEIRSQNKICLIKNFLRHLRCSFQTTFKWMNSSGPSCTVLSDLANKDCS